MIVARCSLVVTLLALLSSCDVLFGACPPGSFETADGRCFVEEDERPSLRDRDRDVDNEDPDPDGAEGEGEGVVAEGEGEGVVAEGEGEFVIEGEGEGEDVVIAEGEGEGEDVVIAEGEGEGIVVIAEGEGEGEAPVGGTGREVEPNNNTGDSGAQIVVGDVDDTGVVRGEVGGAGDDVDFVRVRVADAGSYVVRLSCSGAADLDLQIGEDVSDSSSCTEELVVSVDRAGDVIVVVVVSFQGASAWTVEVTAAEGPTCADSCFGDCVDLDADPDHCGGCGNACAGNETCSQGSCVLQLNEQCHPLLDSCVPGACCISGFCQVAGGC